MHGSSTIQNITGGRQERLKVANGVEVEVEDVESFTLELHTGLRLRLNNVLYVPTLCGNSISVSYLIDVMFNAILETNSFC